jgi:glycerol-3-phosphate dehydrogenase
VGVGSSGDTLGPFCSTNAGRDSAQRALRHRLQERERRCSERRRDTRHLDPHQTVPSAQQCFVSQSIRDAEPRTEVVLLQRPHWFITGILEQLRSKLKTPTCPLISFEGKFNV